MFLRRLASAAVTFAVLGAVFCSPNAEAAARPQFVRSTVSVDGQLMSRLAAFYVDRLSAEPGAIPNEATWHESDGCRRCDAGPLLAAASAYRAAGDASMLQTSLAGFDYLITQDVSADGSFDPPSIVDGRDVDTMFFTDELGLAKIQLKASLGRSRSRSWTNAVAGGADFLVRNGNLSWYTNGNIVVGNALSMALAYRLTGQVKYAQDYQTALSFAVRPAQERWPGYGFVVTKTPMRTDGSDGAGYFTETGPNGPGFDADYSQLQLDQLARIYLVNGDPVVLRLMNMVFNQLMSRVNTSTWALDTSGGTRHPQANRLVTFDTAALYVLAAVGGRTDLTSYVAGQLNAIDGEFRNPAYVGDRAAYAIGMITTSVLWAARRSGA